MKNFIYIIITSSVIPLIGITYFDWSFSSVLIYYWFEIVLFGVFAVIKRPGGVSLPNQKASSLSSILLQHMFFITSYAYFVYVFSGTPDITSSLAISCSVLAIFFLLTRSDTPIKVTTMTHSRLFICHIVIVFVTIIISQSLTTAAALGLLVTLKTTLDLFILYSQKNEFGNA